LAVSGFCLVSVSEAHALHRTGCMPAAHTWQLRAPALRRGMRTDITCPATREKTRCRHNLPRKESATSMPFVQHRPSLCVGPRETPLSWAYFLSDPLPLPPLHCVRVDAAGTAHTPTAASRSYSHVRARSSHGLLAAHLGHPLLGCTIPADLVGQPRAFSVLSLL